MKTGSKHTHKPKLTSELLHRSYLRLNEQIHSLSDSILRLTAWHTLFLKSHDHSQRSHKITHMTIIFLIGIIGIFFYQSGHYTNEILFIVILPLTIKIPESAFLYHLFGHIFIFHTLSFPMQASSQNIIADFCKMSIYFFGIVNIGIYKTFKGSMMLVFISCFLKDSFQLFCSLL